MAGFDPVSAGAAAVGAAGSLYFGSRAEKEQRRIRNIELAERARQQAIRSRVAEQLRPSLEAEALGQEPLAARLAREQEESMLLEQAGREATARGQALRDLFARKGVARGRGAGRPEEFAGPAALGTIREAGEQDRSAVRDLARQLALMNRQQRAAGVGSARSQLFQLGEFEAGGAVPTSVDTSSEMGGAAFGEVLGRGLDLLFAGQGGATTEPTSTQAGADGGLRVGTSPGYRERLRRFRGE